MHNGSKDVELRNVCIWAYILKIYTYLIIYSSNKHHNLTQNWTLTLSKNT